MFFIWQMKWNEMKSDNSDVNIFPKCSGSLFIPVRFRGLIKTVTSELYLVAELLNVYLSNKIKEHEFVKFVEEHGLC